MKSVRQLQFTVPLSLICFLVASVNLFATEANQKGRDIFRRTCVKCHGKNGEGVKGKYDTELHGDWPLDRLTRYIGRNMPDDNPGKLKGAETEAVARYVYDAFYSREAQARNHPARIELVRLTNRQYVNTVADLIKRFTGGESNVGRERGLRAIYYKGRHFDQKVIERVDRQVNFDFGDKDFAGETPGTNGFSIQWRGSLIADESGEYEFIVKSPNGVRLWLNNDNEPLVDAWVSSGTAHEHRTKLRLIGGRAYPLRLDLFKFKDKTSAISLQWKPPHSVEQSIPAHNLSPDHVAATFVCGTPFPPDDSSVGYERGVSISKQWDEAATQAALEVATFVVENLDRLSHSMPSDTNRAAKVETFCNEFVATAFRRPLTEEQKRLFVSTHFKRAGKTEEAVKRIVLLALKAPQFLYLGLEKGKPDDFEIASRLSFGLWDSLPDEQLWKAAEQGNLHTREEVAQQARRMLADGRTCAKTQYFLQHWLQMNQRDDLSKDDKLYPGFTPEIIADLRTSLNVFLEDAVWNESSDWRKLLLADYVFLNDRLAKFYGVNKDCGDDFVKVNFDSKERCGVVTHPYLLAEFSYQKSTSPIHRGVFLTRNIVGRSLKPPPMAMTFKDADFDPSLTMREKVEKLTRPEACISCHSVINPLGFSLENYDAVGRFRTHEKDKAIDAVSDYVTDEGKTVRLTGARDVAEFAVNSEQAQNAFIEQLFNQVVKQPMLAYGADVMPRLRESFVASEFNVQKLLVEIVGVSALHGVETAVQTAKKK